MDTVGNGTWLPGVEGIILAAGLSSRAGVNKMTLDIRGKTILGRCIDGMYGICSRIIVVGGCRASDILPVIAGYSKAVLVYNRNYRDGMFSSVKKGLEHVRSGRFFLTPGDYPFITPEVYESILGIDADIVVPANNGRAGHPVLIKSGLIDEIRSNPSYHSLKDFIESRGYTAAEVGDKGILMDVDTLEDYARICGEFSMQG